MMGIRPNAESFRILALASLASKDLNQARLEIRKALELEPRWKSVRFTAATIDYFSALAVPALPDRVVSWPEPVDWSMVRRDDESVNRLRAAAKIFRELADGSEKSREEQTILQTWYLASLLNDAEKQEEATECCRNILQTDPTNYGAIAWAVGRPLGVDLAPSEKALRALLVTGAGKLPHVLALVSCHLAAQRGMDAIAVLNEAKSLFEQQNATQLWLFWYAQALAVAGDPESALKTIDAVNPEPEIRSARTVILRAIAKKSRESSELIKHLDKCYEETHDPSFLLEACELKAYEKDWSYVAQRAQPLANEIGTASAIRLAVIAAFNDNRFDICLALLDSNREVFGHKKLPNELRRLRVLCHHALGTLPAAVAEAESLAREEPTTQNLLALAQIYFDKADFKGLALTTRQLIDRTDLTSEQSLRIGRLIQWEDRDLAVSLWRRSIHLDLSAEETAMAVSLGFQLGLDDELRPLLSKMATLAASGEGPIRVAKIQDMIPLIEQRRMQGQTLFKAYRDALAPIHLIADAAAIPLADFYHRLLEDNATKPDPLNQSSLFARHGGRSVTPGFPESMPQWHLNLDITAVFLAEQLGILEEVAKTCKPIRFSSKLIPTLVAMIDRMLPEQPSRLRAYEQVLDLEEKGNLRAVDCELSPDYQNTVLVQELGKEWVGLFEKARAEHGYLVDFLPLTKRDLSGPLTALPDEASRYLINCRSIVEALRQQGPLSEEDYLKALGNLGEEGNKAADKIPPQGAILYCEGTIPSFLATAGLLPTVCTRFQVRIEKVELERTRSELRNYNRKSALAQWITSLLDRLREGLDNGSYELIAPAVSRDNSRGEDSIGDLTTRCLTDLMQFRPREGDVLWIDDRYVNAFSHREGAPIITICDVLKALVSAGALKPIDYYNKIASLRASNVKFIPIEKDELLYQLFQAEVDKDKRTLTETHNLTVLRRYISTCLLQVDIPQWPPMPKGSPNENGEIGFFVTLGRAITNALVDLWKTADEDESDCEARSEWLIANLFQEHIGLNNPNFQQRPQEDYQYLVTLRLADLISAAIGLDSHHEPGNSSIRQKYFNWLLRRVLQTRLDANPYLTAAIADVFKRTLFDVEKDIRGKHPRAVAMMVLQKFFEDLPDPLRDELIRDADFMASIGLKSQTTISFEGFVFENSQFWRVVAIAVNGGESSITSLVEKHEISFRRATGRGGQAAVSFAHPLNKKNIILDDDVIRLALDSPAEREEILRRNRQWFDCSPDIMEQVVAKIISIENVERRIEEVKSWRDSSALIYYADLEQRLNATPQFKSRDLLPPSVEGMLRHLRLSSDIEQDQSFSSILDESALSLIRDEGLQAAIERLCGLPVSIPHAIVAAVCELSKVDRQKLIKRLLRVSGSPVSKMHLLTLVLLGFEDSLAYQRLARRIIRRLVSSDGLPEFEAFGAILNWVSEEFGHWQELRVLPPRLRLALVWTHSHRLFGALVLAGAPPDWLRDRFSTMGQHLPHELFHRDPAYWFDIAHPRQLNRTMLLFSGLSYSLGKEAARVLGAQLYNSLISEAYQIIESVRMPVLPLLKDPSLASDSLDSFLASDRGQTFLDLLGNENASGLSRESLLAMTEQSIRKLAEHTDDFRSWTVIFAIIGDMPPYKEVIDRLSVNLSQTDFCYLFEKDHKFTHYLLMAATAWANSIGDEQVSNHLKEQLIKICELQSRAAVNTPSAATISEESEGAALLLLESALNLSRATQPPNNVLSEFGDLVTRMVQAWSSLVPIFRPVIQRFCDELPISQAKHFYPLLLRLRAT